jgi:ferrous iron transport protein B
MEKKITVAIVGNPNVGKSVMFNNLTGAYVTVSNYPGTTVEVSRGKGKIGEDEIEVIDTPGMYSLLPITEEEQVARAILFEEHPEVVLHMVDAKNLERMLTFTVQLIEAALPTILVLNMMDEVEKLGKKIRVEILEEELQTPVVPTVSTTGKGIDILKGKIEDYVRKSKGKDKV